LLFSSFAWLREPPIRPSKSARLSPPPLIFRQALERFKFGGGEEADEPDGGGKAI